MFKFTHTLSRWSLAVVGFSVGTVFAQIPSLSAEGSVSSGRIAVSQAVAVPSGIDSGGIQARWLNEQQFRSLSQTFTWNSDAPLAAIGLRVSPDQNKRYVFSESQRYALDVQELSDARTVLKTLASVEFTLEPALIQPEKYLVITLPAPLALTEGGRFGFHIRPLEPSARNHIIFSTGGNGKGDQFPDGVANQVGLPGPVSAGERYGNAKADFDLTFVLLTKE